MVSLLEISYKHFNIDNVNKKNDNGYLIVGELDYSILSCFPYV